MRMHGAIVFAFCSVAVFGGTNPAGLPVFTIEMDRSSYPLVDTFGDPTVIGPRVWYRGGNASMGDDQQKFEFAIPEEDLAADSLTAYVYRRGCRVAYYQIHNVKSDSLRRKFHCEPAADRPVTVTIENADVLTMGNLFAWASYESPRGHKNPQGILGYQDLSLSVGVFPITSNGSFTLPIPDFGNDPVLLQTAASLEENPENGESTFDIFIAPLHGAVLGRLVVGDTKRGKALRVAREYPSELRLTFVAQR